MHVGGLDVAQTPVGALANGPEGLPVGHGDASADPEIAGVAHQPSTRWMRWELYKPAPNNRPSKRSGNPEAAPGRPPPPPPHQPQTRLDA
jgi:hypothetical protein